MANTRTKTVQDSANTENLSNQNTNEIIDENEELKKKLEEMKAAIEFLQKQYDNKDSLALPDSNQPKNGKMITFVNMTNGIFVLKGSQNYTIDKQFESRSFTEKEAEIIANNMNSSIRNGLIYICDSDFVKNHFLEDAYANILSFETLQGLFDNSSNYIIESYKIATQEQKDIIISMVIEKKAKGMPVDGNIIIELSRLSGKNLMDIEVDD